MRALMVQGTSSWAEIGVAQEPEILQRLLGTRPARTLDDTLDDLTDAAMAALDVDVVEATVGLR